MKIEAQAKKWFSYKKNRVVIVEIIKQKIVSLDSKVSLKATYKITSSEKLFSFSR